MPPPQPAVKRALGSGGADQSWASGEVGRAQRSDRETPWGTHPYYGLPRSTRRSYLVPGPPFLLRTQDVRKTWRRLDATKSKSKESDEDIPDYPVVKNMLHRITADLTLDPSTAHHHLLVSPDGRSVCLAPPGTPVPPDGPARFDQLPAVLGAQGFRAGRHCWEVETAGRTSSWESTDEDRESHYAVGAAGESVQRKGRVGLCPAGAVWAVEGRGGRLWALTAPEPTPLGGGRPPPRRIRVDLDWERGRVAFYDGHSLDLLFAFQASSSLGEPVFPLLCTRDPQNPLRIVPADG
ncbi:RING finger protein 39 isoform X2 [Macrotis lagotis]|uniref:RING finger protein 39 isoform X2 n=1 Tax=Macrotis lagotis TaxID=92651 RepID=UPI003D68FC1A